MFYWLLPLSRLCLNRTRTSTLCATHSTRAQLLISKSPQSRCLQCRLLHQLRTSTRGGSPSPHAPHALIHIAHRRIVSTLLDAHPDDRLFVRANVTGGVAGAGGAGMEARGREEYGRGQCASTRCVRKYQSQRRDEAEQPTSCAPREPGNICARLRCLPSASAPKREVVPTVDVYVSASFATDIKAG